MKALATLLLYLLKKRELGTSNELKHQLWVYRQTH